MIEGDRRILICQRSREEAFRRSVKAHKKAKDVLAAKFDELLKQAKESPDTHPPQRDIDLD